VQKCRPKSELNISGVRAVTSVEACTTVGRILLPMEALKPWLVSPDANFPWTRWGGDASRGRDLPAKP